MRKFYFVWILMGFVWNSVSAQEIFQLDSVYWQIHTPENFKLTKEFNSQIEFNICSIFKPEESHVNKLNATYISNQNLKNLTLEIYAFSLVETFKKGYNSGDFSAEVQLERKKIQDIPFYLIRSQIRHLESDYQYISDVYLTEINGKEFNVTLIYDNDEDKQTLEEIFYNSSFS